MLNICLEVLSLAPFRTKDVWPHEHSHVALAIRSHKKIGTMFCNIRYWPMLVTSHCVQNLGPIENPRNLQFIRRTICSNKASVCTVGWHLQMQDYGCFLIRHEIPHSFVTAIHVSRLYKLQCHARNLALKNRCTFCPRHTFVNRRRRTISQ